MPLKDIRLLRPFITDADDLYSFDHIDQMKSEITAIYGFDEKKLLRVNRFTATDSKGRLHWRYISTTRDATSVEIKINLSNDPKNKNEVTRYANICTGVPFLNDTETALHYWNGTKFVELPVALDIFNRFQDSANQRAINWTKIPVLLGSEAEISALTNIKDGEKFLVCNMPSANSAGDISMYFASTEAPTAFPKNTEITTATAGIHVYKVSSVNKGTISDGTPDNTRGVLNITDSDIATGKALKFVQSNSVNKKDITTVVSQGGNDKVASAEVTKKLSERVDSLIVARQAELEVNGNVKKYLYKKRSLFKRNINAGANTFTFTLDDTNEEARVLSDIATFMVYTMKSHKSSWEFSFNKTNKVLTLTYNKAADDSNTSILVEVLHKYIEITN